MSGRDARRIRLAQWAMRAADHVNGMDREDIRAKHLGNTCEYARMYMGHQCRCGHKPPSWDAVYAHVIRLMEREGWL
jgi:hypothetical protein